MYCVWPGVVPVQRMFLCFKLTATNEPIVSMIGIREGIPRSFVLAMWNYDIEERPVVVVEAVVTLVVGEVVVVMLVAADISAVDEIVVATVSVTLGRCVVVVISIFLHSVSSPR